MKKGFFLKALGGKNWIGGLYYIKNIAYSLLVNGYFSKNFRLVIYTEKDNVHYFKDLPGNVEIAISHFKNEKLSKMEMLFLFFRYRVRYAYPFETQLSSFGVTSIAWIPDFQHNHYPVFFAENERQDRDNRFMKLAKSNYPLVLSSEDALNDFNQFYAPTNKMVYVVHFVSYIEKTIEEINENECVSIKEKYHLNGKSYACIMNQFWPHKNHVVVLEALQKYYRENPSSDLEIIMTGMLNKNKFPEYSERVFSLLDSIELKNRVHLLGFIDRNEQIALMRDSQFIIQPSLFEGWGTVVEDSKVLDKTVLLSDIPVHREQKNEKCILFDPHDPEGLAVLIQKEHLKSHNDNYLAGLEDMKKRALQYSEVFEKLIKNLEGE